MYGKNKAIQEKFDSGELIEATVLQKVKGGFITDIGDKTEIRAFLPASQLDIRPQSDLDKFVGQKLEVRIIKFTNRDIVVSRRVLLEEQRETLKKETLAKLEEGMEIQGKVVNIINQGAFIDLGGLEGFIPISEISWGRINHPSDIISADEEINTKIISIKNEEKVTLSLKAVTPDPWDSVNQRYQSGNKVEGKVASLMDFGAFIQLEPGIEGLVHVSEITWTKSFRHPKEVIEKGEKVEVRVLEISRENRRISLGLKQVEEDPWPELVKYFETGKKIKGEIIRVLDKGIIVKLDKDVEGIIPFGLHSKKDRKLIGGNYTVGASIEALVMEVKPEEKKVVLFIDELGVPKKKKTSKNPVKEYLKNQEGPATERINIPEELRELGKQNTE